MSFCIFLLILSLALVVRAAPAALSPPVSILLPRAPTIDNGSTRQRDVPGIIWSCLATTAACTYFAVHPNIPNPSAHAMEVIGEQCLLAFYAFIAPEVMILWAMRQRRAAYKIKQKFDNEFQGAQNNLIGSQRDSETGHNEHSRNEGTDAMLVESGAEHLPTNPGKIQNANKYEEWSMTHSFFLQMGGFMVRESSQTYRILTLDQLRNAFIRLEVSEQEIKDRSKGDLIAKVVTVGQTWWFVVQCCARFAQGLNVSIPELTTLAFAALNALTWFMWRNKPLHVRLPIYVDPDGSRISGPDFEEMRSDRRKKNRRKVWDWFSFAKSQDEAGSIEPEELLGWKRNPASSAPKDDRPILCQLLYHLRKPLLDMIGTEESAPISVKEFPTRETRMELPNNKVKYYYMENVERFYVSEIEREDWRIMLLMSAGIGIAFGGIHCVTWAPLFHFPTQVEKVMWETSAIIITAIPVALFFSFSSHYLYRWIGKRSGAEKKGEDYWYNKWVLWFENGLFTFFIKVMRYVGTIIYILARLILLGLAISSLRDLPPSTYQAVIWTNFIPHI
ncbi:hypothetical protein AX16_003051 [Volvariella volvacea WC 439]|nr:hypothetical protein AX16_003051 [Volvariella volvacea WC 439]